MADEAAGAGATAVTAAEAAQAVARVPRHPVVLVALIGLPVLAFARFGFDAQGVVTALAAMALVALGAIDLEHRTLPDRIVLPAIGVVLGARIALFPEDALEWVLAAIAAAAFMALPLLKRRDAVGAGDVKLAALLGAAAGWPAFAAIMIGCLATMPFALMIWRREGSIGEATLPFGPFLAFGGLVVLFAA